MRFGYFQNVIDTGTLAAKLGTTTHLSPLLRKARRLELDAKGLAHLAIQRGCDYYDAGELFPPSRISDQQFSNEELAIALLQPALPYDPQRLRLGAAMLAAEGNNPMEVAHLAKMERCEPVVRYIVLAGQKFEPSNEYWTTLLSMLPAVPLPKSGVMPHPTRFVAMTGLTRRGVETVTEWIRPTKVPAHG